MALMLSAPMEGDGNEGWVGEGFEPEIVCEGLSHELGKVVGEVEFFLVFECVDELEREVMAVESGGGKLEGEFDIAAVGALDMVGKVAVEWFGTGLAVRGSNFRQFGEAAGAE